jgi:hypothetical protein
MKSTPIKKLIKKNYPIMIKTIKKTIASVKLELTAGP